MAIRFVYSGATGANNGTSEADAYTTLGAAISASTNADVIKVKSDAITGHSETAGAAITYTLPTSPGLQILAVVFNGSGTGALDASGAAVNVGASNNALTINGNAYIYGIQFAAGTGNSANAFLNIGTGAVSTNLTFERCTLSAPTTNASGFTFVGQSALNNQRECEIRFIDCVSSSGAALAVRFVLGAVRFTASGLSLAGTAPTTVFAARTGASAAPDVLITASDLSGVAWTNLVAVGQNATGRMRFHQCKLRSGFTIATGTFPGPGGVEVEVMDCDSGDNHYRYTKVAWQGTVSLDNTKYAAGSSNGTDSFSFAMVTNANAKFEWPLIAPPVTWFNDTLSAMTTTVPVAHNGVGGGTGGVLTNREIWQETLAKVTSGVPQGTWNVADRAADILATAADQDSDGATSWTGSSIATHDKLVSGSFTPAEVGDIQVLVKLAKPSVTVYASPLVLSGARKVWEAFGVLANEAANAGGGGGTTIVTQGVIGG